MGLKVLSAKQYAMCYRVPKKTQEIANARKKLGQFSDTMYAVVGGENMNIPKANRMLPISFQATDGTLRILRMKPVVVDTTRFLDSNVHNRQYAELLLLVPWFDEVEELGMACQDSDTCTMIHAAHIDEIRTVKDGCKSFILKHI